MVVTPDATRRRAIGQILLLAAGFLVLVAVSATSVVLVNKARQDSALVVHTVEVENQINSLLLEIRRAESAARGYLVTLGPEFLGDHETAAAAIIPGVEKLARLTADNPYQVENVRKLRPAVEARLDQFAREMNFVKQGQPTGTVALVREAAASDTTGSIRDVAIAMRGEEGRLFALRTANADRTQQLASLVTIAGSALVIALAAISIFLVRRSARARATRPRRCCETTTSIWKRPWTSVPPTFARPTTKSSASPISSATTCARRWSTSWASPANSRNCAPTFSGGSRPSAAPRVRRRCR
jgi:CHASE3 domain sensor protein